MVCPMESICIKNIKELPAAASAFLKQIGESRIVAFYGDMGAGKTTFIKNICLELGVPDIVNSPTFTIVNEYRTSADEAIFHFDFYRINKPEEAYDIGIEEYFDSGSLCLMEWPEKIEQILPPDTLRVKISVQNDGSRVITLL